MTGTADRSREYILVVEDDKDLRDSLCEALELEGYVAVSAENGQAALRHLATGAQPCMILLDLMMPVMDGWTFRAEQRRDPALKDIPVIVFSARLGVANAISSLGVVAGVAKPVDPDRILDLVAQHCRPQAA